MRLIISMSLGFTIGMAGSGAVTATTGADGYRLAAIAVVAVIGLAAHFSQLWKAA